MSSSPPFVSPSAWPVNVDNGKIHGGTWQTLHLLTGLSIHQIPWYISLIEINGSTRRGCPRVYPEESGSFFSARSRFVQLVCNPLHSVSVAGVRVARRNDGFGTPPPKTGPLLNDRVTG